MNEPENKITAEHEEIDLEQQCADLRRTTLLLLLGLVMLSVTFTAFLWLQARRSGHDLRLVRQQAQQLAETNAKEGPAIQNFVARLVQYGQTHPEFEEVLKKYNIRSAPSTSPAAGPTGTGPVPANR